MSGANESDPAPEPRAPSRRTEGAGGARILFTGGSGLLGSAFRKIRPEYDYPSETVFDVTDYRGMEAYLRRGAYTTIFHAAAFTSPPKIDADPLQALEVNVIGTANVVRLAMAHRLKLIYVSTDYVFRGDRGRYREEDELHPVNKYAWSKLGGECAVRLSDDSLILRTTFGPAPFPYPKAFVDQWTSRESVDVIAGLMARLIDRNARGVVHVGGERKTVYEYATSLDPARPIGELSIKDAGFAAPADTSLDCALMKKILLAPDGGIRKEERT
ncbi:MAG: sugar nucleotide-binding protein [Spirochaetales bacterium]|nr:sugar nucleotide-binding protein [Spirochaetales bacterium]